MESGYPSESVTPARARSTDSSEVHLPSVLPSHSTSGEPQSTKRSLHRNSALSLPSGDALTTATPFRSDTGGHGATGSEN